MMGAPGERGLTHAVAQEACERLQAGALIEGSVSAVGRAIVVALVASRLHDGRTIARDQVEVERKEDVLKAVGRIASSHAAVARRVEPLARGPQRADRGGDHRRRSRR